MGGHRRREGVGTMNAMEGDQMTDPQQEARTLTLGEWMILAAKMAAQEHLRQSVSSVPPQGLSNDTSGDAPADIASASRAIATR
jgi:hypothetical protein